MSYTSTSPLEALCFGETIVDFLPGRKGRLRHVDSFTKVVGGAPANVALGLARLGCRSGMMGRLGEDEFGHFLRESLVREGVDMQGVEMTSEAPTGFTFVSLSETGERSFMSVTATTADQTLRPEHLPTERIEWADMILFGSNQMTESVSRMAVLLAMKSAKKYGKFVIFDPNIRLHLWLRPQEVRPSVVTALELVDLVKLNDEEIEFIGQGRTPHAIYEELLRPLGITALVSTHASGGAQVFCDDLHVSVRAPAVTVVDTTGAGDGFVAGLMLFMIRHARGLEVRDRDHVRQMLCSWDEATWRRALDLACFVGSHVCQTLGATPGLPRRKDVPWKRFDLEP